MATATTWYILKQFMPGANVWVIKLDDNDTVYSYHTEEEATAALPSVQTSYPDRNLKIESRLVA